MESEVSEYFDFLTEGLAQTGPFVAKAFYRPESDTLDNVIVDTREPQLN